MVNDPYRLRPPARAEAAAVTTLLCDADLVDHGTATISQPELVSHWEQAGFDLAADALVAEAAEGGLAAYGDVLARAGPGDPEPRINVSVCVHPAHRGRGLGARLLAQLEARAGALAAGRPAVLRNSVAGGDAPARALLAQFGYAPEGESWHMRLEMDAPPPAPEWPAGLAPRAFEPGRDDAAVHALIQETFADLDGFVPSSLAQWAAQRMHPAIFDPTLWFVAFEAEQMAGAALAHNFGDAGWIAQIGVRRPWRRRGLALALLRQVFGEFYRRGQRIVELGVDAANATGASRVYQRAGMRPARHYARYEKRLAAPVSAS
jgi:mycothiol synthase